MCKNYFILHTQYFKAKVRKCQGKKGRREMSEERNGVTETEHLAVKQTPSAVNEHFIVN